MKGNLKISYWLLLGILFFISCQKEDVKVSTNSEKSHIDKLLQRFNDAGSNEVMIAAHRGDWQNNPENSLAAIQSCINKNIDIVEIDIRASADGEFVLMHDKTLDRTTNGRGEVAKKTLRQLKTLQLKDKNGKLTSEQIPTLREALLLMKDNILFMLDKSEVYISSIMPLLEETGTKHQAIFLFFDEYQTIKNRFKENRDSVLLIPAIHRSNDNIPKYVSDYQNLLQPAAFAFWIKNENSVVHQSMTGMQGQHRIWVNTYNADHCAGHTDAASLLDPEAGWGWCVQQGGNILLSDYPINLLQYLRNINRHE